MDTINQAVHVELDTRHGELEARARAFVASHIAAREDEHSDDFAREATRELGDAGLIDVCVDLDVRGICVTREVLGASSGLVDSMLALQGLGYAPIELAGTDAQKARWREPVRTGRAIPAFAITEPEAGSDVGNLRCRAERDGDDWVLNGEKCFITNAGLADFYVTFARTGDDGARGISAFLVPADQVRVAERYELIAPHPCGALVYEDARVPGDALIGAEGKGFSIAMSTLDRFRATVGAAALGMAQRALNEAVARAQSRSQFGKPIARYQQVAAMLADSWAELAGARLLVYRAATARDQGERDAGMCASAAKMLATETAQKVIDRAVQVHGGQGVRRGTVVERLYREIRALRIYEGTTEIQRLVLSRALLTAPRG